MAYHQLFIHTDGYNDGNGAQGWVIDFGDRDRECVEFERDDWNDKGVPKRCLKIVTFPRVPTQRQLDAKQAELNTPKAT